MRLYLRSAGSPVRLGLIAALVFFAVATMSVSAPLLTASTQPLRVSYLGPSTQLSGLVSLRASASTRGARVVAVTFLCDGKPLGSDTTKPFRLDIDAGALDPGVHQLHLAAVDSLGRRTESRAIPVTVAAYRARLWHHRVTASQELSPGSHEGELSSAWAPAATGFQESRWGAMHG